MRCLNIRLIKTRKSHMRTGSFKLRVQILLAIFCVLKPMNSLAISDIIRHKSYIHLILPLLKHSSWKIHSMAPKWSAWCHLLPINNKWQYLFTFIIDEDIFRFSWLGSQGESYVNLAVECLATSQEGVSYLVMNITDVFGPLDGFSFVEELVLLSSCIGEGLRSTLSRGSCS